MSQDEQDRRLRHQIEKYRSKVGQEAVSYMQDRFNPDLNFSLMSFAFNLSINLNIEIDNTIVFPPETQPETKAKYGSAKYGISKYDPLAPIGVLIPDNLSKQLYIWVTQHFTYPNQRGYKYSLDMALKYLYAEMPILEKFADYDVWNVRFRKIEAWRNWGAYYNLANYNTHVYQSSKIFVRVTDDPEFYGYSINPRTVRNDNLSSQLYDHGLWDASFYAGDQAPYPEILLLVDNVYCYMPVYNLANYNSDVYFDKPYFDSNVLVDIIEKFKQKNQVQYQDYLWLTRDKEMKTMYAIHATYQHTVLNKIINSYKRIINSPIEIGKYYAFAMEYSYQKRFMQLVEAQKVIEKYKRMGLNESLLNSIAFNTQRKHP